MTDQPQQNTYLPGYNQVSHHEWRTAENSAAYLLPTLKSMASSNPYLRLLDIGAGSGTITASLAKYMPASGHIVATDISQEILQKASRFAAQAGVGKDMISFQTADVYELPFEDGSFDIVHASMVLSHLDKPVEAYKEMLRVMKPSGGVVANRESDLTMWSYYPKLPGICRFHEVLLETTKSYGGNVDAGPRLVSWAMQAGAKREDITASMGTWMYSTPKERAMWGGSMAQRIREGGMAAKIRELKLATETEIREMGEAWDTWIATADACHGSMHGEILIRT